MKQINKLNKALNKLKEGTLFAVSIGNKSKPYSNIERVDVTFNPYYELFYDKQEQGFKIHPDNDYISINEIHRRFNKSNMQVLGVITSI